MTSAPPTLLRARKRLCRALIASALAASALLPEASAFADDPGGDTVFAQSLFEEGRRLMEAKQYAEACPKFEESQRLRPGTGTVLNLALCNEGLGKTATAWGYFKEALFASKKENNEARQAFAQEHISALEPRLSKLQIDAESTPGLVIHRDGQEVPAAALGTSIPVDPGEHTIEATAPGYAVWSSSIKVGDSADMKKVAVPKLTPAPADQTKPAAAPAAPAPPRGTPPLRTLGFVVGGAGVAALGVGAVFGLLASTQASNAENDPKLCPKKLCTPAGSQEISAAKTKAVVSTVGFGVGLAAIAAGAVMVLSPSAPAEQPKAAQRGWTTVTARILPTLGTSTAGLNVIGDF